MNFKIRNYRQVSHADIEINSITCVGGKGTAGKTSALGAIASIMTGLPNPYKDVAKKHMSRMVHGGTSSGSIELKGVKDLSAEIIWPDCKYSASTNHKLISPVVAGFNSIVDLNSPERVKYIIKMMKANPTEPDLVLAFKEAKIYPPSATIGIQKSFIKLWEDIKINDWEVVYQKMRERGTKLKGQWELITGLNFGTKIIEDYEPPNFMEDLKKIKRETLVKERDQSQEWCNAASKDAITSDVEKTRLTKLSEGLTKLKAKKESIVLQSDTVSQSISELIEKRNNAEKRGLLCPECKTKLTLSNGELKTIPKEEKTASFDYESGIKSLRLKDTMLSQEFGENKRAIDEAEDANKKLEELKSPGKESEHNLDDVSEKLAIALDRLESYDKYHQAHDISNKITANKKVVDILSPKGLRLTILQNRLKMLNKTLKILCDTANWDLVEFDDECNIKANGVPYHNVFLSRSERHRVKILLQLVCAMGEKSDFVIIDDVDILMKTERNQLLAILKHLSSGIRKYKFIFGVAYNSKEEMPDFRKFNFGTKENPVRGSGRSYWIEDGKVL